MNGVGLVLETRKRRLLISLSRVQKAKDNLLHCIILASPRNCAILPNYKLW
jgi:hypothetical protein